jgi:hypothetical protein
MKLLNRLQVQVADATSSGSQIALCPILTPEHSAPAQKRHADYPDIWMDTYSNATASAASSSCSHVLVLGTQAAVSQFGTADADGTVEPTSTGEEPTSTGKSTSFKVQNQLNSRTVLMITTDSDSASS